MQRNTSVILGDHFAEFVEDKISEGRFESTSEAVRAGLRLLEVDEAKLEQLKADLQKGKNSGISNRTPKDIRQAVLDKLGANANLPTQ